MNSYFKPLRRKLGVLTRVMACVFAAGWIRSQYTQDVAVISHLVLASNDSHLSIVVAETKDFSLDSSPVQPDVWEKKVRVTWMKTVLGIRLGQGQNNMAVANEIAFGIFPYQSLVLPLTLLYAWLLLSKPRTKLEPPAPPASENA